MRRSGRARRPVLHYGEIEAYSGEENSDEDHYSDTEYMPPRILPTRSCNLRSQSVNEYSSFSVGSKLSREKREVLKLIDIKFKFETYTELRELLLKLLNDISNHESAGPFLEPVPESVPYYYTYILEPMDLSTIRSKVQDFSYSTEQAFFDDLNLMFENCKTFNEPGTEVSRAGVNLRKFVTKARKAHFPGFEDLDTESLIIDRITREKQELDSMGKPVLKDIVKDENKPVKVEKEEPVIEEDTRFGMKAMFPKYQHESKLNKSVFASNPDLVEVAIFFWLLGSTENFTVIGNQNFTLSALERAFLVPHQSSLFLSLNFLLLSRITGVRKMRKIFSIPLNDVDGYSDIIDAKVLGSEFNLGKFLLKFHEVILLWNRSRNNFKTDMDLIQTGELDVSIMKLEQIELELSYYNELLFPLSDAEDFEAFCDQPTVRVVPFEDINSFIELTAATRLELTKALISWRLVGYQDSNISNAIRLLDAESLNQTPVGIDTQGNRYFYFPQFFRECRLYVLKPCLEEQFYLFQEQRQAFESTRAITSLIKTFLKLKSRKYVEASDKVYDLRDLKGKFKRKLSRRETSAHFSGLCQELLVFLKSLDQGSTKETISENSSHSCVYYPVMKFLKPLVISKVEEEVERAETHVLDLPDVEISDTEESGSDDDSSISESDEETIRNYKRKREQIEPPKVAKPIETTVKDDEASKGADSPEMEDIIFDGSDYIPIRRSSRARKTVKRLEIDYGSERKKRRIASKPTVKTSKSRKLKKIKSTITSSKPGELVKNEVSEIESIMLALRKDPFETFLIETDKSLLAVYRDLFKRFAQVEKMPKMPSSWKLICDNPSTLDKFIESLEGSSYEKKCNRKLVQRLHEIRETSADLLLEQQRQLDKEEKKQIKDLEIQNASRKRSNRIQQEQEKLNLIREQQEYERMQEIRKDCAAALWKDYQKKRKKQLDRERRILRIEYQRALEREQQEKLELQQQQEELERKARLEKVRQEVQAKQEAYRRQRELEIEAYKRSQTMKAAHQGHYINRGQARQYGYPQVQQQRLPQQQQHLTARIQPSQMNPYALQRLQQGQNFVTSPRQQQQYPSHFHMQNYQVPSASLGFQNLPGQSQQYYSNQMLQQRQSVQQHQNLNTARILPAYQNLPQFQKNDNSSDWRNDRHRTNPNQDNYY